MPLCAKCQRDAPEGALFCPFCSSPLLPPHGEGQPIDPLIGKKINNTYLVQEKIGGGGMGQVYKAVQINLDRPVALKLLRPAFQSDPSIVQRFHREARASSKLHHPNIIAVMDFGQTEDGTLYMAMEYVPDRNLLRVMREEFPLGEARVVNLTAQILSALAEAHRAGIVHRDLKPENVMVESRPDEPDFVKVLDFGIAQIQEPSDGQGRLTQVGVVCGTPDYMSPEQAAMLPLDARSDLYSVGIMLYEMLAGRHPFQATTPPAMVQAHVVQTPPPMATRCPPGRRVSPALEVLVLRALEKHPENRFPTAEEMRWELLSCPLDPELAAGTAEPNAGPALPHLPRTPSTPGSVRLRTLSSPPVPPAGLPRPPTPARPHTPAVARAATPPRPTTPQASSPGVSPEAGPHTPPGRRSPAPLTETLLGATTPSPSVLPPRGTTPVPPPPPGRPRSPLLLLGAGVVGVGALAAAGFFFAGGFRNLDVPSPAGPTAPAQPEEGPVATATPAPSLDALPPVATAPTPSPAAEPPTPSQPTPPAGPASESAPSPVVAAVAPEAGSTAPPPAPASELSRPEVATKRARPTSGKTTHAVATPRGRGRKAAAPAAVSDLHPGTERSKVGVRSDPSAAPSASESQPAVTPPRTATAAPATKEATPSPSTDPASAATSSSSPSASPNRREAFVTRDVLAFQQFFGNPELKERGRGLVSGARWLLEPNGTLIFAPSEKMGGIFPMAVRATRDGNRVWFEGIRTAPAGSSTAYVRISGNLSLATADPLLTLDLEIGRAQGTDGSELDPTYRARTRLRLAQQ